MIAGMSDEAKDLVLGNPRQDVEFLRVAPVEGTYDHKRRHAARVNNQPFSDDALVPVWDFFLGRMDGTVVRFHVNYGDNKVEVGTVNNPAILPGPPAAGKGKPDRKGT